MSQLLLQTVFFVLQIYLSKAIKNHSINSVFCYGLLALLLFIVLVKTTAFVLQLRLTISQDIDSPGESSGEFSGESPGCGKWMGIF